MPALMMDYSDYLSTCNNGSSNLNPNGFSVKNLLHTGQDMPSAAAYQYSYAAAAAAVQAAVDPYSNPQDAYNYSNYNYSSSPYASHGMSVPQNSNFNSLYNSAYLSSRNSSGVSGSGSSSVAHLPLTSPHVQQLYDLKPPTTTALNAEALINELTSQSGNDKRKYDFNLLTFPSARL